MNPNRRVILVAAAVSRRMISFILAAVFALIVSPSFAQKKDPLITTGPDGRLIYAVDASSNRVPDFSTCGYASSGRPLPDAPVRIVVAPIEGDESARIQAAIDYVGRLPLDTNGMRGAVLLLKGRHQVSAKVVTSLSPSITGDSPGGLQIINSGVVIRGQGMGDGGTVLVAAGMDRRTLVQVGTGGKFRNAYDAGTHSQIKDDFVPVGATTFHVNDAGAFKPGQRVTITRPSLQKWIDQLGAVEFGGGEGGGWKPGSHDITWNRVVKSMEGDLVILDAPITTAIEKSLAPVQAWNQDDHILNVGIENLRLESEFDAANPQDEEHSWCAITMERAADCWVRQVAFSHFAGSAVTLYETCQRVTVQDCLSLAPVSEIAGYRRHTFFTMGQQTLFLRCYAEHGRHDFSVGFCAAGPNAFVQCEAREALDDSGPIESWASGVLYDNVTIDGNALTLGYRPGNNAAIGWAAANCVLWNCSASVIRCWNPPGAQNWAFGSWASFEGDGIWRSSNDFMKPDSLFAAQVKDRLGAEATERLHIMPRPHEESSNPTIEKAQELAAASHQPAAQLKDYILAAAKRDPIANEPDDAKPIESVKPISSALPTSHFVLTLTNGWLTMNGRLLIGGSADVTWWRGSIHPDEATNFGVALTRFVPGRTGPGFTDDLTEVAQSLVSDGRAALDHNYGLWYDRRRDDHERVRRINADVLPPFYEQPFARTGPGTAWNGLSKYDLTKFNPWYWSRLRGFADLCEQRGLVLFHQNYFQHNIIEAGAHWVDCPWRSANNINHTDFPEPPPFAGDKRIFQAELFYDETNPARRQLHENFIRQCLANFATNSNVIQFTAAEFTGPAHFMAFWLDTVAAWEKENPRSRPLIALSCPKDVQDAMLADPKRNATVDVIDFRYWWRTEKGEFAPPGGKNLAPRQFERQWKGGRPNDASLAGMATEYRAKFPAKALICDFDAAGWAWVCAGGSMPRLPRTTDSKLLDAIPRMVSWVEASRNGQRVLREAGKQLLVYSAAGARDLDLTAESGSFRVQVVDPKTGMVTALPDPITGGGPVKLPAEIVWLTREQP